MTQQHHNALHTDLYQLTMMQTYVKKGLHNQKVVFDMFFRSLPFGNGYAVFAGLEQIMDFLTNLSFSEEDLFYLESNGFSQEFLEILKDLRFTGDVYSVKEGEMIFPNEPVLTVEARIIEAMLVETAILNIFNHETLIATKASRMREAAGDKKLIEFGARRAHGLGAALYGARSAYLGGFDGTSLVEAGRKFGVPVFGTMSHAFIQSYENELDAFVDYGEENEGNVVLLVDTYDTLKIGVPNAIKAAEILKEKNIGVDAIRLDSGDMAYLSKSARKMLDEAGYTEIGIVASSDLDEEVISNFESQKAKVDTYAVGTKLITAYDQPALGGVYKLVERIDDGERMPKIKISDDVEKVLIPGRKKLYRIINQETNKAEADYIARYDETFPEEGFDLLLFDPVHTWKEKKVKKYRAIELQDKVIDKGKRFLTMVTLEESKKYKQQAMMMFWQEHKRMTHPAEYYVDLSLELWELRKKMITEKRNQIKVESQEDQ